MDSKNKEINDDLREIANFTKSKLPKGYGFITFAFEFGDNEGRRMMYISNADRKDAHKALREYLDTINDNNYGKDI